MIGGWASNNKYALLGAVRASSQMISYELAMSLSIIAIVMMSGSLSMSEIVAQQQGFNWNIIYQPLGFLIFLICAFAETNRAPFDLPECETELVGGYHTEYSSMKLGFYLFAEYINMFISGAVMATLFLGGYHFPGLDKLGLSPNVFAFVSFLVLFTKITFFGFIYMWIRWTLAPFPLRPADAARLEESDPAGDIEYGDHGSCNFVETNEKPDRPIENSLQQKDVLLGKDLSPCDPGGMRITFGHLFRKKTTVQYPEVKREFSDIYRGKHVLKRDDEGRERCTACGLCAVACPAEAITMVAAERKPGEEHLYREEKYAVVYEIDMLRCIFCGDCRRGLPERGDLPDQGDRTFRIRAR